MLSNLKKLLFHPLFLTGILPIIAGTFPAYGATSYIFPAEPAIYNTPEMIALDLQYWQGVAKTKSLQASIVEAIMAKENMRSSLNSIQEPLRSASKEYITQTEAKIAILDQKLIKKMSNWLKENARLTAISKQLALSYLAKRPAISPQPTKRRRLS